jgi:hypothetical protein
MHFHSPAKAASLFAFLFLFAAFSLQAGKPWRPGIEQLERESELIVLGRITRVEPSFVADEQGRAYRLAVVEVTEVLKGTPPKTLLVPIIAEPLYDEKGAQLPRSTAYRYELKEVAHSYVLFLTKPPLAGASYYVPAGNGSGIVDLDQDRPGDGPAELQKIRTYLAGK